MIRTAQRGEEISQAIRRWWRAWWESIRFDVSHEDYIQTHT